jgi:hypothetical protein
VATGTTYDIRVTNIAGQSATGAADKYNVTTNRFFMFFD